MKNTSLLAGVPIAGTEGLRPTLPTPAAPPPAPDISYPETAGAQPSTAAPPASSASAAPEKPAEAGPLVSLPPAASRAARTELEKVLLTVVSELTGYPVEMLGLEMDIEADLGIDSIKRVEILSAMRERAPGLPEVDAWEARETQLGKAGGVALPPQPTGALPAAVCGPNGSRKDKCLRTIPPRENGELGDGINAARVGFSRFWFDEVKCRYGLEALRRTARNSMRKPARSRIHRSTIGQATRLTPSAMPPWRGRKLGQTRHPSM